VLVDFPSDNLFQHLSLNSSKAIYDATKLSLNALLPFSPKAKTKAPDKPTFSNPELSTHDSFFARFFKKRNTEAKL